VFLHAFIPLLGDVPQPQMSMINTFSLVAYMLGLGVSGWLANHRRERIMMIGGVVFLAVVAYPALALVVHSASWQWVAVAHAVLALGAGLYVGPIHAASASLFPVAVRYRGIALSSTLAWSLLGGTTPWICMLLWESTQTPWAVCCWLWGACVLALCGFIFGARDVRAHQQALHPAE
jgi:MFS family permease